MAIILEFNLICRRFIDLERVLQNPKIHKLEITMEKISTIDDWTWTNQKKMQMCIRDRTYTYSEGV